MPFHVNWHLESVHSHKMPSLIFSEKNIRMSSAANMLGTLQAKSSRMYLYATHRLYKMKINKYVTVTELVTRWHFYLEVQSTLVISNSKGLSEILRDIRSSTYQVCRIEEKIIWLTTFNKLIGNWTFEVRDILKILWKRGEIAPQEQFLLFSTIFSICC